MALKVLLLKRSLEKKKERLEELRSKKSDFDKREKELEVSIDEVNTSEEQQAVEEEVEKFDGEKSAFEKEIEDLEKEIATDEEEIKELEDKNKEGEETVAQKSTQVVEKERGRVMNMTTRKKSFGMTYEERNALVQREDVKTFLTRTRTAIKEKRDITGTELTIPEIMLEMIRDNLDRYSKLINKVNLRKLKGKGRQNILGAIPEGIWMEMVDSLNELTFGFSQVEVDGYKVGGYIPVPNSTIEDSDENLVVIIMDMIAQALGLALDKAIVYGKDNKMPQGIITRLAQSTKPSDWNKKGPEWTDLSITNILKFASASMKGEVLLSKIIELSALPKEDYSNGKMIWLMNKKTKTMIQSKLVTANAAGVFVASMSDSMPIVGGEIITLPFIPEGDIIYGYSSLYLLSERAGANLESSRENQFIEDNTVFRGTARYDGLPVFGEAFCAVNINNVAVTTSIKFAGITEPDTPVA